MAYNPFDFFRRNQKLFFGGLTILVMFMFILSFGRGDFFSWFPQQMARWQTHGDVMAKIDGNTIKQSQLGDVSNERNLANGYMNDAAKKAMEASITATSTAVDGADPDLRRQLGQYFQMFYQALAVRRSDPEELAYVRLQLEKRSYDLLKLENDNTLKSADKARVKSVRQFSQLVLGEMARRVGGDRSESGVYFANQPNRTERDRLEFLLWKKKADQLGIRYTQEHVAKLVEEEFPSITPDVLKSLAAEALSKSNKRENELYDALADEFRVRAAQTAVLGLNAVRTTSLSTSGTTEERYEHFLQETTTTKYTFLTIPVEAYLSLVQGEPTEAELTEIFNKANSIDPDPASYTPGIREPRKVGVQWVEITGNEDYYKALATQRGEAFKKLQTSTAAQALLGPTVAPVPAAYSYDEYLSAQAEVVKHRQQRTANPGRPALGNNLLGCVGGGLMTDPNSFYSYPEMLSKMKNPADQGDKLLDAEFVQPELMAALVGLSGTGFATSAPLLAPTTAVTETAFRQSREKRVVAGIQAFQVPAGGGAVVFADAAGGVATLTAATPAPLTQAVVQPMLDKQTTEQLRVVVATDEVQAFEKELARITGQKYETPKGADKATIEKGEREHKAKVTKEASEYVAKWLGDRKLKTGGTTEPRSVHTLADDPGLAPLLAQDKMLFDFSDKLKDTRVRTAFGQAFVNETKVRVGNDLRSANRQKPVTGLYQVRQYDPSQRRTDRQDYSPNDPDVEYDNPMFAQFIGQMFATRVTAGKPLTLVWRTAEVEAVRPLSLTSDKTAREKCKTIWRLNKARDLARKAADEAAATIAKAKADAGPAGLQPTQVTQVTADVLTQLKKPFGNDPVADKFQLFFQEPAFSAAKLIVQNQFGEPQPMVLPFNPQHRSVVYETEEMRKELLANKDKDVGTTFVFTDQPKKNLYLTVVAATEQKDDRMFRDFVLYPETSTQLGDIIAPRFAGYIHDADRKTAVALLKAEFNYKDENPKLDEKRE